MQKTFENKLVYQALEQIKNWGGRLEYKSAPKKGTSAYLSFKRAPAPKWFCESLNLSKAGRVVVVDDDFSIHEVWRERFAKRIPLTHISSLGDFENLGLGADVGSALFLFDYEFLGSSQSGLDAIERYSLAPQSILVTSHFEEKALQEKCERQKLQLIPKNMAPFVPTAF